MENNTLLLDTTLRTGMSGKFIALIEDGRLDEFQAARKKILVLRQKLSKIAGELAQINKQDWLIRFAHRCMGRGQNFTRCLSEKATQLEIDKALIEKKLFETRALVDQLEPGLTESTHSLALKGNAKEARKTLQQQAGPVVAARNAVIKKCGDMLVRQICKKLDGQDTPIPLPASWIERFPDIATWSKAYLHPKIYNRLHKMISKARAER